MIPENTKKLITEFRSLRGQSSEKPKTPVSSQRKKRRNTPYDSFLKKFNSIEESIDDFNTQDLLYYFREVAQENGYKYVISNISKEMAVMKRVRVNFNNREICCMIEFLYESEQDYLDKTRLSPNILASGWVNTIYADMNLWVDDEYSPNSGKNNRVSSREWDAKKAKAEKDVKIGVKL